MDHSEQLELGLDDRERRWFDFDDSKVLDDDVWIGQSHRVEFDDDEVELDADDLEELFVRS
ncbi:MAG: hypothetical protein WKG01_30490 [Kofleriaceae bacterium]